MSIFIDLLIGKNKLPPPTLPVDVPPLTEWNDALWTSVLQRHVASTGRVDYEGIQQDVGFQQLVEVVGRQSPLSHPNLFPTDAHILSFWINTYNILTIWGVVTDGIRRSIHESTVSGWIRINPGQDFFVANRFQIGGEWTNLYDLENQIIRVLGDARIHAAINCASNSCPTLENRSFSAENLDDRLSRSMRRMVNSERHLRLDSTTKTVYASLIFKWYKADFHAKNTHRLFDYWLRFAEEPLTSKLHRAAEEQFRIEWTPYDWGLNH